MCNKRDVDGVLKQIEESQDLNDIRRLLEEIDVCDKCPEQARRDGEQALACRCRRHFRSELNNSIYSMACRKN